MLADYGFITEETLAYFTPRLTEAPQDVDFALRLRQAARHDARRPGGRAGGAALQVRRAVGAARCAALSPMSSRALIPPGAFVPEVTMMDRFLVSDASVLAFAPHIVFRFDEVRRRWIILAPERLMLPDEQAVEILQLVDGRTGIARHRRFAGRPIQPGAARSDCQGRHRDAAGSRRQGMSRRCPPRIDPPLALLAELTHRCPLACPYCSNPLNLERAAGELSEQRLAACARRGRGPWRAAGAFLRRRADGAPRSGGADQRSEWPRPLQQPHHLRHAGRRARDRGLRRRGARSMSS